MVATALLGVVAGCNDAASATEFVKSFYDWYVPAVNDSGAHWRTALSTRSALFSDTLLAALREDSASQENAPRGDNVGLDYDPFLSSQDRCERYEVASPTTRDSMTLVPVHAVCSGRRDSMPTVIVEVAPSGDSWRFTNFGQLLTNLEQLRNARLRLTTLKGDMPRPTRSLLGVELSRDNLATARQRLGAATEWRAGDAGESTVQQCYRGTAGAGSFVLIVSSEGEMGGVDHEIDELRLTRRPQPATVTSHCAILSPGPVPATPGGLTLGLTAESVVTLLGTPSLQNADSVVYEWSTDQPIAPTDPTYAHWNARRAECFNGNAPFTYVAARIAIRFDAAGASDIRLMRSDNAIC